MSTNLTINSIKGDTLCKFTNYDQQAVNRILHGLGVGVHVPSNIYRIKGQVMLQAGYNDTVFRVNHPNRLTPAYIMNRGAYKPNVNKLAAGIASLNMEDKFLVKNWIETPRFIFIHYTEGRDIPALRDKGKVKDHWAIYNKTVRTLIHHATSDTRAMLENDLEPVGMPFWPQSINHKGEMYMVFSKETIKRYIERGINRNDKLQSIYDSMPDGEVCIMIVN